MIIAVPKNAKLGEGFTKAQITKGFEDPGRKPGRIAGGYMSDLAALKKTIILCPFCEHKFNPRKSNYEVWNRFYMAHGRCDGCKQLSFQAKIYNHEAYTSAVEMPGNRRRGRWGRNR